MRTVRCSGRRWGASVCRGMCLSSGVSARRCLPGGGVCPGRCLRRGVFIPACTGADPPLVNRFTDACENITFPQLLLLTVIKYSRTFDYGSPHWAVTSLLCPDCCLATYTDRVARNNCNVTFRTERATICSAAYDSYALLETDTGTDLDLDSCTIQKLGVGIWVRVCAMWT